MAIKPKKPDRKLFAKLRPLEDAVAASENTDADTKELKAVSKEFEDSKKDLGDAMMTFHQVFEEVFKLAPHMEKDPKKPVPIPYPKLAALEKRANAAHKDTEKALKKHDKAQRKLIKVADKQIKTLKPLAKSSNGDEAGTMKGLVSSKNMAATHFKTHSMNVKFQGKAAVLINKVTTHNKK